MKYVNVSLTAQRYDVLIYCKCTYYTLNVKLCNQDTTEKNQTQFCKLFLKDENVSGLFLSFFFIISYSASCHESIKPDCLCSRFYLG